MTSIGKSTGVSTSTDATVQAAAVDGEFTSRLFRHFTPVITEADDGGCSI